MLKSLLAVLALGLLLSPNFVDAQTRGRRATSTQQQRRRATTSSSTGRGGQALVAARGRVADRIKALTHFVYLYGGIANEIEVADSQVGRGPASSDLIQLTNRRRAALQTSVRDVRAGLELLEQEFRPTTGLERYYTRLAGVAAAAADAEELIAAGQLKQAGRTLLQIVNQLTDTLSEM